MEQNECLHRDEDLIYLQEENIFPCEGCCHEFDTDSYSCDMCRPSKTYYLYRCKCGKEIKKETRIEKNPTTQKQNKNPISPKTTVKNYRVSALSKAEIARTKNIALLSACVEQGKDFEICKSALDRLRSLYSSNISELVKILAKRLKDFIIANAMEKSCKREEKILRNLFVEYREYAPDCKLNITGVHIDSTEHVDCPFDDWDDISTGYSFGGLDEEIHSDYTEHYDTTDLT